jgi:hypothetical protein
MSIICLSLKNQTKTKCKMVTYEDLYHNNKKGFELMENTANALILQFKEPLKYDLTIPDAYSIKRLMHIFEDTLYGRVIDPVEVNCCYPIYSDKSLKLNFRKLTSLRVIGGLEFCFTIEDKYDNISIYSHLNRNQALFGNEGQYYRFREGKREEIQKQVETYFKQEELVFFNKFGEVIKPYVKNLDNPSYPEGK